MINKLLLIAAIFIFSSHGLMAVDGKLKDPTSPPKFATPKAGTEQKTKLRLTEVRIAKKGIDRKKKKKKTVQMKFNY